MWVQPLGLAQRQVKCQPQHQARLDGQVRIVGLPTAGVGRRVARHAAITSCVTHNVRLPRRRSPASYCAQFLTLNFIFGMWCRRSALCLFGTARIGKALDNPRQPTPPRRHPCNNASDEVTEEKLVQAISGYRSRSH